jgi:hypothetical protein
MSEDSLFDKISVGKLEKRMQLKITDKQPMKVCISIASRSLGNPLHASIPKD